ncbi:MAG: hypothetical protein ACK46A_10475 [Akkermansiaceae bacterium]
MTHPWKPLITEHALAAACGRSRELLSGINVHAGKVTYKTGRRGAWAGIS